jgi:transposase InsO family protein
MNLTPREPHPFEYVEVFYNRKRRHPTLGYLSPHEYEKINTT